ncbi:MAG TPA: hypothetical protein VFG55_04550 [Rhodanobacteraceae bacterium]|nr:hypothetical protein [Rhodanobacteraceae bacterium]
MQAAGLRGYSTFDRGGILPSAMSSAAPAMRFSTNSSRAAETATASVVISRSVEPADPKQDIMHVSRFTGLFAVLLATWLLVSTTVLAQAREISVQDAIERVQHQTNGKVLAVQTLNLGKRKIYRIKVLTPDGQVKVVQVAANE